MTAPLDIDALEKVARAAGDGPWTHDPQKGTPGKCMLAQVWGPGGHSLAELESTDDPAVASALAEHIATFDPPTVLRLLAERRAIAAEIVELRDALNRLLGSAKGARSALADDGAKSQTLDDCVAAADAALAKAGAR